MPAGKKTVFYNWEWFQKPFDEVVFYIHQKQMDLARQTVRDWVNLIGNRHPEISIMLASFCLAVFDNIEEADKKACIDFVFSLPEDSIKGMDVELFDCLSGMEWMAYQNIGVTPSLAGGFPTEQTTLLFTGLMCYVAGIFWVFDIPPTMKPSEMLIALVEDHAKKAALASDLN